MNSLETAAYYSQPELLQLLLEHCEAYVYSNDFLRTIETIEKILEANAGCTEEMS